MLKKLLSLVLMMLLLLPLAGCATKEASKKAAPEKVTVLLDWFPNTNHTGLYVAIEKGYYKQAGLDVKLVQSAEGGTAQLVAAGKGDFGISYQEELTTARSENIPVVALASIIQHNTSGFAAPVSKNIKSPKDFEGKTYGGWGSPLESAMLKYLMDKDQADFAKLKVVNVGSADFFTSIQSNVDFAWIYYGWTGIEAEQKKIPLDFIELKDQDPALDFYSPIIISSESMIAQKPELVEKFMHATSQGYQYAIKHPTEAGQILIKNVPDINKELVMASQAYLSPRYQNDAPRWGEMKPVVWKNFADFMVANGLIKQNIDPDKAFTNKFLP
jgi:ABC-type nitrate/sulfonate/bicarbonate transport system substrate-binding protein